MTTFYCVQTTHHNDRKIHITMHTVSAESLPDNLAIYGDKFDTYSDYFMTSGACDNYYNNCVASADNLHIELI